MKTYFPPKPLLVSLTQPLFKELELRNDCVCEEKFNGTRLIFYRHADGSYEFWNRHGEPIKYKPSQELMEQLNLIEWIGEEVLDGELLHFKKEHTKNIVVFFDIYETNGQSTTGWTFEKRRKLLEEKIPKQSKVFLAPQWHGGASDAFLKIYNSFTKLDEIEGIVIKSLNAKVKLGRSSSPVVPYMFKVRKPVVSKNTGNVTIRF